MDPSELVVAASKAERPTVSYMTGCTLASVAPLNTWIPLLMATQTLKLVVRDGAAEDVEEEDVEEEDLVGLRGPLASDGSACEGGGGGDGVGGGGMLHGPGISCAGNATSACGAVGSGSTFAR